MPIDKFGRHMLTRRSQPCPQTPPILAAPDPTTTLSSLCLVQIHGRDERITGQTKSYTFYVLDDNSISYTMPFSGTIESLHSSPNVTIFVNNDNYDPDNKSLNKGDELSFSLPPLGSRLPLFVEILLRCPLVKNE